MDQPQHQKLEILKGGLMRAREFIKESPGFNAGGPSGTNFPRGYDLPSQMYQQGQRFSRPVSDFNMDPFDDNIVVHVERIDQRIEGGMTVRDSIVSYAKQLAVKPRELARVYNRFKAKFNIT